MFLTRSPQYKNRVLVSPINHCKWGIDSRYPYLHAHLTKNVFILSVCANETTAPIIEQFIRITTYIALIVEIKGDWEEAMSK